LRAASLIPRSVLLAGLIAVQFLAGCGSGSSGGSGGGGNPPPPPQNAVPVITSLSPSSASQGGSAFTVTITGYNFISGSSVLWNNTARTTTYTSSTQLQVQITTADITNAGSAALSVMNPSPGGGSSGAAEFVIDPLSNPAPTLLSFLPTSANVGSSSILLNVYGENFTTGSTVNWNGTALPTSYLSDTELETEIPAANLAETGLAEITVATPVPGGGVSGAQLFGINYQPTVVNQLANDMVWDPINQVIYLSVPSLATANGNTIAVLNPSSGSVQAAQFAGSEPDVLAISDDNQFLYAGVDGSSSVQRFTLPGLVPDVDYLLGADSFFGPYFGLDLQVAPGLAHTTAVSRGTMLVSPVAQGGIAIYDDTTERPTVADASGNLYDSLAWGTDKALYAINNEVSSFDLYVLSVGAGGVTLKSDYQNAFSYFAAHMHYDSGTGLVYTDDGHVINPTNGQQVGAFPAAGYMVPDSTLNRAFFFGQTPGQSGTTSFTIESFDLTTYAPIAAMVVPHVAGYPLRFIRWGASGLAFNDDAGYVYLINNSFVSGAKAEAASNKTQGRVHPVLRTWQAAKLGPQEKAESVVRPNRTAPIWARARTGQANPAPTINSLSPSAAQAGHVSLSGFTLTVTGSNFVSLSTIEWNGSAQPTEFVSTTELQAQISIGNVESVGTVGISVVTPGPGGGTSNTLNFNVVSEVTSGPPGILSLYPASVPAGSSGLSVQVNGVWLDASSVVYWNGSPRTATGTGDLQIQLTAADVATPGYGIVTVVTAGGVSNSYPFQILYTPTSVSQQTNDMIWDPVNQVFYISVPSAASTYANQVCVLNPATSAISNCQTGNEPNVLAISDDSQFLYVGMDGANLVQRYTLPSLAPDISFGVGTDPYDGAYVARDIQVAPGAPHTIAVARGILNLDPSSEGGIAIYDDGTQRPTFAQGWGPTSNSYDSIQWGSDSTALYASCMQNSSMDFYTLTVNSSGVVLDHDYPGVWWNPGRIHYNAPSGFIYSDDGFHAVNPQTGLPVGLFEVGGGWPMAPDSSLNTVFMLAQYIWQQNTNYTIDLFDLSHYVKAGWVPFPTTAQLGLNPPGRFLRWGTDGLAINFTGQGGSIVLLSGSFVSQGQKHAAKNGKAPREH